MAYRVVSDLEGATFETFAYEVYEDAQYNNLVTTVGEINASGVEISIGVVGKRALAGDARFDNRSSETGLSYSGQPYSAVGVDYHNQAGQARDFEDLFLSVSGASGRLMLCEQVSSNGVPNFADKTSIAFSSLPFSDLKGTSQADYDNDGDLDLFVAGGNSNPATLYRNEGNGTFSDQSQILGSSLKRQNVYAGVWADYDGDGWVDLYLCRSSGPSGGQEPDYLFRNKIPYNGLFYDATTSSTIDVGSGNLTNSFSAVWADVNGDNKLDLFVAENTPLSSPPDPGVHCRLFINDPNEIGRFSEEASTRFHSLDDVTQQMTAVDMADVDLDGDVDLVAGFEGLNIGAVIYRNDGSGNFQAEDAIYFSDANGTSGVRFVDLDLDGRPDLLLTSSETATEPRYYRNTIDENGAIEYFNVTDQVFPTDFGGKAEGIVFLDWNRDGDQDLFLGRESNSGQVFYRSTREDGTDTPDQTTIALRLLSPDMVNNAVGIGAKAYVSSLNQLMLQWVDGGSGRGGQDDLVLTFPVDPLPSTTVLVTVTWPNGWVQSESVPIHTPGNSPFLLVDNTNPTVLETSVQGTSEFDPLSGVTIFIFTWMTEFYFNPSMDKVEFDLSGVPVRCHPEVSEITPTTDGADHTYIRLSSGSYRHTLRWTGWLCEPNCTLPFTVTSGHRPGILSTSSVKELIFRFCLSSF